MRVSVSAGAYRSFTMTRCGLPVLFQIVVVLVISDLVTAKAESYESLTNVVGGSSSQSPDNDEESSSLRNLTKFKLRPCKGFRNEGSTVEIPMYSLLDLLEYEPMQFEIGDTLLKCPTGKEPKKTRTTIISHRKFSESLSQVDESALVNEIFSRLRNEVFLLQNGYLSVGNNNTATYYSLEEFCLEDIQGTGEDRVAEFRLCDFDKRRPIYPKCCPIGMVFNQDEGICQATKDNDGPEFLDVNSYKLVKFKDLNPVYISPRVNCKDDEHETWDSDNCNVVFYPATDNSFAFIGATRKWEFIEKDVTKCFDYSVGVNITRKQAITSHCGGKKVARDQKHKAGVSKIYMVSMYVGAVFHFLTTLVYLVTWKKQNIHGMTLSSCTASLFWMQIFLGTAHLLGLGQYDNLRESTFCFLNSIGGQYFMIAAFTWLLVVNIDLWRTFRSIRADGSKSLKRFLSYSAVGWGFPFLVLVVSISLEFSYKCRKSGVPVPEYREHYCFVSPWAQGYYVYYILSFLIALSCIFAVLTLFGLYTFKKDTNNLRSSKRSADRQNIVLFLKLGVVMGLTWVFEVISWMLTSDEHDSSTVWIILDLYNALSAILIFIIFVCKRTTLNLLVQTFPILEGLSVAVSKFTSTFGGDLDSGNTNSTGVPGHNSIAKKSIELNSMKNGGNTNSGFE